MLEDRHYTVPKTLFVGFNEFSTIYDNNNFDFTVEHSDNNNQMYITFFTELKERLEDFEFTDIKYKDLDEENIVKKLKRKSKTKSK